MKRRVWGTQRITGKEEMDERDMMKGTRRTGREAGDSSITDVGIRNRSERVTTSGQLVGLGMGGVDWHVLSITRGLRHGPDLRWCDWPVSGRLSAR